MGYRYDDLPIRRWRGPGPQRIGKLIKGTLESIPHGVDHFEEHQIQQTWNNHVHPQIKAQTKYLRYRDGVLRVGIKSPAARDWLNVRREEIRKALNRKMGKSLVRELTFH